MLPERDVYHVVGFSGGIDSQATARWVLNREDPDAVILLNSDAGGNEHPMTVEFVRWYSENVHPVITVTPIYADLGNRCRAERERRGIPDDAPMSFCDMAAIKGIFPSRRRQFCTEHLKLAPQRRWEAANIPASCDVIRYSGVRRSESENRKNTPYRQWCGYFDCELICPVVDFTKEMCFEYVKSHGEQINPLYTLGFGRVGCAPCVNSNKVDILLWVQRFPEMIDKVREWEKRTGKTFFAPCVPGMALNWIDDVVAWANTLRGGKDADLTALMSPPACESKYGLCE